MVEFSCLFTDIGHPNFFTEEESGVKNVTFIIIAGSVIAICIVIAVFVAVIIFITCRERRKRKHIDETTRICNKLEDENKEMKERIKELEKNDKPTLNIQALMNLPFAYTYTEPVMLTTIHKKVVTGKSS